MALRSVDMSAAFYYLLYLGKLVWVLRHFQITVRFYVVFNDLLHSVGNFNLHISARLLSSNFSKPFYYFKQLTWKNALTPSTFEVYIQCTSNLQSAAPVR